MRHGEISRGMFPGYPISAITNGVHAVSWTAAPFRNLFDRYLATWRHDNRYLRHAIGIPLAELCQAHQETRRTMLAALKSRSGVQFDEKVFTIGFTRRAAVSKRPELLFSDLERLKRIACQVGPLQIVYGGKTHPRDLQGKTTIQHVSAAAAALKGIIPTVYIENCDLNWGQLLTGGADLWLNTPQPPEEASGMSGMKEALEGAPGLIRSSCLCTMGDRVNTRESCASASLCMVHSSTLSACSRNTSDADCWGHWPTRVQCMEVHPAARPGPPDR